jgi:hypothetical protein
LDIVIGNKLDRLYYIFHCSIRSGFGHAERACLLLSASLMFYGYSIYFAIVILTNSDIHPSILFYSLVVLFGVGVMVGPSRYFVKTGRYRRIIDKLGSPRDISRSKRFYYRIISIVLFFLGSLATFIFSGIMLSFHLSLIRN